MLRWYYVTCFVCSFKDKIGSLLLVATPWDFQKGIYSKIYDVVDLVVPIMENMPVIPSEFVTNFFAILQSDKIVKKYDKLSFLHCLKERELFWKIEDWVHEGIDVSTSVMKEILISFIKKNKLLNIQWKINNITINPKILSCPTFFIVPKDDNLASVESVLPLIFSIK